MSGTVKGRVGPITHGHTSKGVVTRTYAAWSNMRNRCLNQRDPNYKYYGGRGIRICDRWLKGEDGVGAFACFLSDMGEKPEGLTLERIEVNGDYEPGNCKWATWTDQANNRLNNHRVECWGYSRTLSEWSQITGLGRETIYYRLSRGWAVEEALSRPAGPHVRLSSESILAIFHLARVFPKEVVAETFGVSKKRIKDTLQRGFAGPDILVAAGAFDAY